MKTLFLLLAVCLLFSCKKKNDNPAPTKYTDAQIWDSVGIKYEKQYFVTSTAGAIYDTLIFHSNNTITERSQTFPCSFTYFDTVGVYNNTYLHNTQLVIAKITDTFGSVGVFHGSLKSGNCWIKKIKDTLYNSNFPNSGDTYYLIAK